MSGSYVSSDLRRLVRHRSRECCEYCGMPEKFTFAPHEVGHIIAEKHRGETSAGNLALACVSCNKHKGSDVASVDPDTGETVRLFNPRIDAWREHFDLERDGIVRPLTAVGRVTVFLLQLNRDDRRRERETLFETGAFPIPGTAD